MDPDLTPCVWRNGHTSDEQQHTIEVSAMFQSSSFPHTVIKHDTWFQAGTLAWKFALVRNFLVGRVQHHWFGSHPWQLDSIVRNRKTRPWIYNANLECNSCSRFRNSEYPALTYAAHLDTSAAKCCLPGLGEGWGKERCCENGLESPVTSAVMVRIADLWDCSG